MPRRSRSASRRLARRGHESLAAAEVLERRTLMTAYVVDTLDDVVATDGKVSLREAVAAASTDTAWNEAAAGQGGGVVDTVTFAASIAGGTIKLGGYEIVMAGDLVVSGNVTVDGGGLTRVFKVNFGSTVQVSGLTVTGGRSTDGGGGVRNDGVLTLAGCVVSGNAAVATAYPSGTFNGGGVLNYGLLTVIGSRVADNTAALSGGGIYDAGGGVYGRETTLRLVDSEVSGNTAIGGGGVFHQIGSTAVIEGCVIVGNAVSGTYPDGEGSAGGGIYNFGQMQVLRSTIARNSGNDNQTHAGGGIYCHWGGGMSIVDTLISDNRGGGIRIASRVDSFGTTTDRFLGEVSLLRSTVSGNLGHNGGGILNDGVLEASNVTISGNRAIGHGGGLYNGVEGTTTLTNVTVFGNRADAAGIGFGEGGGVAVADTSDAAGPVTLRNTIIAGNVLGETWLSFPDDVSNLGDPIVASHTLIGDAMSAGGIAGGANGNQVGVDWHAVLDPVLKFNGGPTPTHALIAGSPAIDAGLASEALDPWGGLLRTDQRGAGFPRVLGAEVDLGAFEFGTSVGATEDLVGFHQGGWWAGVSDGDSFTTDAWGEWVGTWDALRHGDFDADSRGDVLGLKDGAWYVGLSDGTGYVTGLWGLWSAVAWENVLVGDVDGDGRDDVVAEVGGAWYAALSTGTGFADPFLLTVTVDEAWRYVRLADTTGDGKDDLLLNLRGTWYVGYYTFLRYSGEEPFVPPHVWGEWADVEFEAVETGDFDADGRADVAGFFGGAWYVAYTNTVGWAFNTGLLAQWAPGAVWEHPVVGDFDGDGRADVAAFAAGAWYVGLSRASGTVTSYWGAWVDVPFGWEEVTVGDFTGDGRDDIAGRCLNSWWVAASSGSAFGTSFWGYWVDVEWRAVAATDATGSGSAPISSPVAVAAEDDEPLAAFWASAEEDEALAGLLAAV